MPESHGTTPTTSTAAAISSRSRPSDTLRVGLIGCGQRGPYLGYVFHTTPGVEVTAVCDVHADHLAKGRELVERVGARPTVHSDYRTLLDRKDVDAVIIATDIHWHALPAIDACAAGRDVYLEKPVATSVREGRAVVDAARRHKRIVQMGTQQHTWEHYREAVELVRSGRLGAISQVRVWDVDNHAPGFGSPPDGPAPRGLDWDFWLGPSPRVPYNANRCEHHDWFFDYAGGWQLSWGAHHFDIVHWAMDVTAPATAMASGGQFAFPGDNTEWPDTFDGACTYPAGPVARDGFLLTYSCRRGSAQPIEGCAHGKAFYGTDGVLIVSRAGFVLRAQPLAGRKGIPERSVPSAKPEHEVVQAHVRTFVENVRARRTPEADALVGHRATNPGHLMNIAWRVGRTIHWDSQTERIVGDAEAERWLTKPYREPWALPS